MNSAPAFFSSGMLAKTIDAGAPPLTSAVPVAASHSQLVVMKLQVAVNFMLNPVMCRMPFVLLRPDAVIVAAQGNAEPPVRGRLKARFVQFGMEQALKVSELIVAAPVVAFVTCPLSVEEQVKVRTAEPDPFVMVSVTEVLVASKLPVQCLPWAAVLHASPVPDPEHTVADAEEARTIAATRATDTAVSSFASFISISLRSRKPNVPIWTLV